MDSRNNINNAYITYPGGHLDIGRYRAPDVRGIGRDTETGDPARLPAQVAGRWGLNKVNKCDVRKIVFCTGLTKAAKAEQKMYRHDQPNEPTKEGLHSNVLQESPFASVSTVSRGHPSLVSLGIGPSPGQVAGSSLVVFWHLSKSSPSI
jgi:hypothetical protein